MSSENPGDQIAVLKACKWTIRAKKKFKYVMVQDIKLRFDELENVDVYMTSYFRTDRDVNTTYAWDIEAFQGKEYSIETYNDTDIYVVPRQENWSESKFKMSFYVYQVNEYEYGNKYN